MTSTKYKSVCFDSRLISVIEAVTITRQLNEMASATGLDLKFDFASDGPDGYSATWRPSRYRVTVMHTDITDVALFKLINAHLLENIYEMAF